MQHYQQRELLSDVLKETIPGGRVKIQLYIYLVFVTHHYLIGMCFIVSIELGIVE
jgi:hypothetical protein